MTAASIFLFLAVVGVAAIAFMACVGMLRDHMEDR